MFGSTTAAHALMEHNLIDDSWLFVNPVILGKGVPVFTSTRQPLKLLSARTFSSGVVVLHYERETQ
jgi:dihydrofolate reductase